MSFSSEVKQEMSVHISPARHCQLAELTAIMHFCGQLGRDSNGNYTIGFQTENSSVITKCFTLFRKTYNIDVSVPVGEEQMQSIMLKIGDLSEAVDGSIIRNSCCKRAYIRGAFLSVGSISDPNKGYHLEFACGNEEQALQLSQVIAGFGIEAKIVLRKKYYVVYIKEGEGIVDLLNVCEAHKALMSFENLRILKDMRNSVNRRVNCELANINKTVSASARQIADIEYIRDYYGFENLSENLRQMAQVRLEYPEAPLKELGTYLEPAVGKSGVNHRLRKLSEIAEQIRL